MSRNEEWVRCFASCRVAEKAGLTLEKEVDEWGKKACVYAIDIAGR